MKKPTQQAITEQNAQYVRQWFEKSGFISQRLDIHNGKQGKSADWKFTMQDLTVICEVKTIFSGGRAGERVEGADEAEGTYRNFKKKLEDKLKADSDVGREPFDITISISRLYVPYKNQYKEFCQWLKGYVLWAKQYHNSDRLHSTSVFKFEQDYREDDGLWFHGAEAFVQILGPGRIPHLEVGFIEGGTAYNDSAIKGEITRAITQIQRSIEIEPLQSAHQIIALWSDSSFLHFRSLLMDDATIRQQFNEQPLRYDLFDWAFSEYPQLTAILLFELRLLEKADFWEFVDPSKLTPFAYIVINPLKSNEEIEAFQNSLLENRVFFKGFDVKPYV